MLRAIIQLSLQQRAMVLLLAAVAVFAGWRALQAIPVDAIPDLSDVQVIVRTPYPGQSPEVIEQQVTYPLSNLMLSVPGAKAVRGFSFQGDAYVYVVFDDATDPETARGRVIEYLNQASSLLPPGLNPALGPDASGVGWVYQYALKDTSGQWDLSDLTSLQDWFLRQELQGLPGVAEVATAGGMVRTYQIVIDPLKLAFYDLSIQQVIAALRANNAESGASVIEQGEAEYLLRVRGYLTDPEQFEQIGLGRVNAQQVPVLLKDIAEVRLGPSLRRGITELNGEGEVVGGIVVMQTGADTQTVVNAVKQRLQELAPGLPEGVEIVPVYDRSDFIQSAIRYLQQKLTEEIIVVALVIGLFLLHLRSTLVVTLVLPLALLLGFVAFRALGLSANIMSLGGIAIAIGALVDAAIVMIENQHKHLEQFWQAHGRAPNGNEHWALVAESCAQVGPALFLTLMVVTVSFFPVFALGGQEGRLFMPLAVTKSVVMAAAAILAITLVPVLMGYFVRGKVISERRNPLSKLLIAVYQPLLKGALRFPWLTLVLFIGLAASVIYPAKRLGSEFMPALFEGDILYMPTTLPGISAGKAAQLLRQTNALIKTVPEVQRVFGKIGRAQTATDPAPLTMIETNIWLKPRDQWRAGLSYQDLVSELDQRVQIPGLTNAWVPPIRTRIEMLSTGIKTPLGLKIAGPDLAEIERIGQRAEQILKSLPQTASVYAERSASGRYLDIVPDRIALARYGLTLADLQQVLSYAVGGAQVDQVVQGNERYPINLRYGREWRESVQALQELPISHGNGLYIPLSEVAKLQMVDGPALVKSENARPVAWVFIDVQDVSIGDYIPLAKAALAENLSLPPTYSVQFSGQYESIQRVKQSLSEIIPLTLVLILVLVTITLGSLTQSLVVLLTLPFGLLGSLWYLWYLQFDLSLAVAVGMLAMLGIAAEFGIVMYLYLNQAWAESREKTSAALRQAVMQGAVQRIRPKAMTCLTVILSLLPLMSGVGIGHEVMQRIAAPMIGGMTVAPLVALLLVPVCFYLTERQKCNS